MSLLQNADSIHDAVSAGNLPEGFSSWNELRGYLQDVMFTVSETIQEADKAQKPLFAEGIHIVCLDDATSKDSA